MTGGQDFDVSSAYIDYQHVHDELFGDEAFDSETGYISSDYRAGVQRLDRTRAAIHSRRIRGMDSVGTVVGRPKFVSILPTCARVGGVVPVSSCFRSPIICDSRKKSTSVRYLKIANLILYVHPIIRDFFSYIHELPDQNPPRKASNRDHDYGISILR